ncbi:MAG: hypothetical protein K2I03_13170 [Lachnospiraceae bacterium]|nr:hypothetical protein [Lachnospiraceae bacterium]
MKKILTNNLLLKLLSVLFAVMLWLVVVNIDDPTVSRTITGISVVIQNDEVITGQQQVYEVISGDSATIVVKGPRSYVDKMTSDDFIAEASFREMSNVYAVPITVRHRYSKYEKSVDITQKTTTMTLKIEKIITRNYEIQIKESEEMSSGYTLGSKSVRPTTVEVSAPESVINLINKAVVEVNLSKYNESTTVSLPIKFYTKSGSIVNLGTDTELSTDTAEVTLGVYSVKEVPLKFTTVGKPADGYELTDVESDIRTVKIAGDNLAGIDNINIPGEVIDVDGKNNDVKLSIDIAGYLPDGVILYDGDELIVNVVAKIEQLVTKRFNIQTKDIEIRNLSGDYTVSYPDGDSVAVQIRGLSKSFENFDVDTLAAYIDLANLGEGENIVGLNISLPDNLSAAVSPTVKVQLTNNQTTAGTTPAHSDEENTSTREPDTVKPTE